MPLPWRHGHLPRPSGFTQRMGTVVGEQWEKSAAQDWNSFPFAGELASFHVSNSGSLDFLVSCWVPENTPNRYSKGCLSKRNWTQPFGNLNLNIRLPPTSKLAPRTGVTAACANKVHSAGRPYMGRLLKVGPTKLRNSLPSASLQNHQAWPYRASKHRLGSPTWSLHDP